MTDQKRAKRAKAAEDDVVLLKDLAPREKVTGGASKIRFGEPTDPRRQGKRGSRGE